MKLSSARARAVSNALLSYGFPSDQIEIRYHGSRDPLIPTGDNVREPRNRRVEVIIK
jgi:outer membrane protein OmpA-like peptidoglycan-associated protein